MDTTTETKAETKTEVQEPQKSPKGGNATRTERIRAQAAAKKQ